MIFIFIITAIIVTILFYKKTIPELETSKRILLIFLRIISLTIVLLLLFNPVYYFVKNLLIKPQIILLNDVSASMEQTDKISKNAVLEDFRKQTERIISATKYKMIKYDFAAGLEGSAKSTNLTKTLNDIAKKHKIENIHSFFLFSDGWFKDEKLDILNDLYIPIYAFSPEFENRDFDIRINDLKYNKTAFKDEVTPISVQVSADNFSGEARVHLIRNDRQIETKKVDFIEDDFQQVFFEHSFENTGLNPFTIKIEADSTNEINPENNIFPAAIQVKNNRSKILLISDKLNWDTKFLIDAINDNPRWEQEFLLKANDFQKDRQKTSLEDHLENTVTILIINNKNLFFSRKDSELLSTFLKNGRGLFILGKAVDTLSDLLPATNSKLKDSFKSTFSFTDESKKYQTFNFSENNILDNIPPVNYFYVNPKIHAKILGEIDNEERSPAILYQNFEEGKVLYFAFTGLWKWQLWTDGNHYSDFIINICSWLGQSTSERFFAFTDKNSYFAGENIHFHLNAYDEKLVSVKGLNAKLVVTMEGKKVFEEFLLARGDEYFLEIPSLEPGNYQYSIKDEISENETDGEFIVHKFNPEHRDRGFNIPLLSYIAKQTGGEILDREKLNLLTLSKAEIKNREIKTEIPIYRKWYVIAIFLITFCLELYLRKRWGLL